MSAFVSKPTDLEIHESGWVKLPSGVWMTNLPVIDAKEHTFARLGHGPAGDWLDDRNWRLPSVGEADLHHGLSLYIEPYTMPTIQMLQQYGIPADNDDAIDSFRDANMMSLQWCKLHDTEVWTMLAEAGWDQHPVSNAGKHWIANGLIYGWWRSGRKMIQTPSGFHRQEPQYVDYATTFHAVSPVRPRASQSPPDTDRAPAASWHEGADLKAMTLAERCLRWLGYQFGTGVREITGSEHNPIILSYSKHCRRGGTFLGVREDGMPIWEGGSRLELQTDDSDSPWCAALASATLRCALLPNELPPHGLRVSVRELVEDAREAGTLRPVNWTPTFGALAICGRAGHDPTKGGRGHVRCVVGVEGPRYLGIGGNEGDTITCAWHSLLASEIRAWIER